MEIASETGKYLLETVSEIIKENLMKTISERQKNSLEVS